MYSAVADSVEAWSAVADDCFVPLQVRPPGSEPRAFHGEVVSHALDHRVTLARIAASSCRMVRTTRAAASDDIPDTLFVSLQRAGTFRATLAGRAAAVTAGEAVLYRSREAMTLDVDDAGSCLTLQIPVDAAGLRDPLVTAALARPVPAAHPLLRVLTATADSLETTAPDLDPVAGARMSSTVIDLVDALLRSVAGDDEARPTGSAALATAMQRFLLDHLGDPALSVDAVARRFGVSARYVGRVFADAGEAPPATWLRDERLRRAARLLERTPSPTVAAVAARSGFADVTTFARAFRRRYGVPPRAWRALP
ncbi:AraC-like DNA-binding protein [Actinomycetospora succinea]|uniref:AraC-like DNA-binding protein n=1 Tax=Actinomycetospora succinea TaxID=663603 RepID=A0A4R6VH78_9PSEU|nr:AraC family transcriptional regulator [Actinomycetospora succinea]TDQ62384.1 AraC-like DNA-binding protein [Actinomycetospora succinea]